MVSCIPLPVTSRYTESSGALCVSPGTPSSRTAPGYVRCFCGSTRTPGVFRSVLVGVRVRGGNRGLRTEIRDSLENTFTEGEGKKRQGCPHRCGTHQVLEGRDGVPSVEEYGGRGTAERFGDERPGPGKETVTVDRAGSERYEGTTGLPLMSWCESPMGRGCGVVRRVKNFVCRGVCGLACPPGSPSYVTVGGTGYSQGEVG